jgi:hypothetical protein
MNVKQRNQQHTIIAGELLHKQKTKGVIKQPTAKYIMKVGYDHIDTQGKV